MTKVTVHSCDLGFVVTKFTRHVIYSKFSYQFIFIPFLCL